MISDNYKPEGSRSSTSSNPCLRHDERSPPEHTTSKFDRFRLQRRVLRRCDLTPADKLVYVALIGRADREGVCWPTVETIANDCSLAVRTVQLALKKLQQLGLVSQRPVSNALLERLNQRQRDQVHHIGRVWVLLNAIWESAVTPRDSQKGRKTERVRRRKSPCVEGAKHSAERAQESAPQQSREQTQEQQSAAPRTAADVLPVQPEDAAQAARSAPDAPMERNREALMGLGIGEPMRTQLAKVPELTPSMIGEASSSGARNGLLVKRIEDAIAVARCSKRCSDAQLDATSRYLQKSKIEDREEELCKLAAKHVLDEAGQERLEHEYRALLDRCTKFARALYEERGIESCAIQIAKRISPSLFKQHLARLRTQSESNEVE